MGRGNMSHYDEDEIETYGAGEYATGIGTGVASGAATGGTLGGPWGAIAGAVIGGVAGGVGTGMEDREYQAAQQQQNDLNKELGDSAIFDNAIAAEGMRESLAIDDASLAARQAAARGGLTTGGAFGLEQAATNDIRQQAGINRAAAIQGAQQMDLARRAQVLDEYQVSQSLANNAAPSAQWQQSMGALNEAAATYGSSQAKGTSANGTVNMGGVGGAQAKGTEAMELKQLNSPYSAPTMQAISAQANTTPLIQQDMMALPVEEQVALSQQYPEAFGGTYQAPEQKIGGWDNSYAGWMSPEIDPLTNAGTGGPGTGAARAPIAGTGATESGRSAPTGAGKGAAQGQRAHATQGAGKGATAPQTAPPKVKPETLKAAETQDADALLSRLDEYEEPGTSEQGERSVAPPKPKKAYADMTPEEQRAARVSNSPATHVSAAADAAGQAVKASNVKEKTYTIEQANSDDHYQSWLDSLTTYQGDPVDDKRRALMRNSLSTYRAYQSGLRK